MEKFLAPTKALLVLAAGALAYQYPPIPQDKTTPVQQRIAIHNPNGNPDPLITGNIGSSFRSRFHWLEHIRTIEPSLRSIWHFRECSELPDLFVAVDHISDLSDVVPGRDTDRPDPGDDVLLQDRLDQFECGSLHEPSDARGHDAV